MGSDDIYIQTRKKYEMAKSLLNEKHRLQKIAGLLKEGSLGPQTDQNLVDTLAKELEDNFGKFYFMSDTVEPNETKKKFQAWEQEKGQQHGEYEVERALTQISMKQQDDAWPQVEDILAAAIPKLGWKKGRFSLDTPEYKQMEADIHDKLGMEKGSGLSYYEVLSNEDRGVQHPLMLRALLKYFPRK